MTTRLLAVLGTSLLATLPAPAQVAGRLSGLVVDASGAAVPGARVSVFLAGSSRAALTAETRSEGLFTIAGVRPEYYDLTVEAQGFVAFTVRRVKVDPAHETAIAPGALPGPGQHRYRALARAVRRYARHQRQRRLGPATKK